MSVPSADIHVQQWQLALIHQKATNVFAHPDINLTLLETFAKTLTNVHLAKFVLLILIVRTRLAHSHASARLDSRLFLTFSTRVLVS